MRELRLPKKRLLKIIGDLLFKTEDDYRGKKQDALIIKNTRLMRVPVPMGVNDIQVLSYGKVFNTTDVIPGLNPRITTFVHDDLTQEFETLRDEKLVYETEKKYIHEFIRELLNCSSSIQDAFELLPDVIEVPLRKDPEYKHLWNLLNEVQKEKPDIVNDLLCGVYVTSEFTQNFTEKHILKLDLIKQRIFINLIDT